MSTPLAEKLRRLIAADGPISVAHYMAHCLGDPQHGYYATRDPLGRAGDFITAPEISQMFGELIGLWCAAVWRQMGAPAPVRVVEFGPGRGTLMADALRACAVVPDFRAAVRVHLVETSPVLRQRQRETLASGAIPLAWHDTLADLPDGPLIVIANEFFDALPVFQAVKTADGWHERVVGLGDDNQLRFGLAPGVLPGFERTLPPHLRDAPVGSIFEWRRNAEVREVSRRIAAFGGAALIIDYGHAESALGETLQAVRGHQYADPLETPGEADLTAHVDFAALKAVATRSGVRTHGPLTQREFLVRLGIAERAARLEQIATQAQAADIRAAVARLTGEGPRDMGALFKVTALARPALGAPPGFDS